MITKQMTNDNMHVNEHESIYVLESTLKDIASRMCLRTNDNHLTVVLSLEGIHI